MCCYKRKKISILARILWSSLWVHFRDARKSSSQETTNNIFSSNNFGFVNSKAAKILQ